MSNSIFTIRPYRKGGIWVFTEPALGLRDEAFVGSVNDMIDAMVKRAGLPKHRKFTAMFGRKPFPGTHMRLMWKSKEDGGNWYWETNVRQQGWLCPALFLFFKTAPKTIYVRAEK